VFSPRVKHGTDNHKSCRDGSFTDSENKPNDEETGKVLASCMATYSNTPDEYVQARDVSLQKTELLCRACAGNLIHFPTGNLCNAKFWGISKARYPRKKVVPNLIHRNKIQTGDWKGETQPIISMSY
jgi:hypothetical protein